MDSQLLYWNVPITKSEKQADGTLLVWGPCTSDRLDHDKQIVDQEWANSALQDWFKSYANVREMHQPSGVGTGLELERRDNQHWLKAKIVDDAAIKKLEHGVYRAFSIGISDAGLDFTKNPAARKGVIVRGMIPEVSIVDRPANDDCQVQIVKGLTGENVAVGNIWADGAFDEETAIDKCYCGCDPALDDDIEKRKLTTEARNKLPNSAFAYVDPEGVGHFPIHDASHVRNALARMNQSPYGPKAKKKILAAARKFGIDVSDDGKMVEGKAVDGDGTTCSTCHGKGTIKDGNMDCPDCKASKAMSDDDGDDDADDQGGPPDGDADDDEVVAGKAVDPPYGMKRLHAHLCWAFAPEAVIETFSGAPTLNDALDPTVFKRAADEASKANEPLQMSELGTAYWWASRLAGTDPAIIKDAQAYLHKMFTDEYPTVHVSPGAVTPGMFRRPFISAGTAEMHATSVPHNPSMAQTPEPSDFQRGPLTSGRERNSPMASGPNTAKRTFYTNTARDTAANVMANLHDHIVSTFPGICPMTREVPTDMMPNNQSASLHSVSGAGRVGKEYDVDEATLKAIVREVMTEGATPDAEALELKKAKKARKRKEMEDELDLLKSQLAEMQKAPDPSLSTRLMGAQPSVLPFVPKAVGAAPEGDVDAAEAAQSNLVKTLVADTRSSDPEVRNGAIQKLRTVVTDSDMLAEVLTCTTA